MKKILFLILLGFSYPTWADECAGGAGTLYTGADGTTQYCLSKKPMNWWSAHAWCDALGMQLFNIQTECDKVILTGYICGQLKTIKTNLSVWTRNVATIETAYGIQTVNNYHIFSAEKTSTRQTLCQFN